VRTTATGALRTITLDRPQARNALDAATTSAVAAVIPQIARDANVYAVALRSSRPGVFCAGGDVRELVAARRHDPKQAHGMLAAEYRCVWLLECFSKPVVALIDGLVMGGGAGITLVNTHRVAAEAYGFAMPEVRIGFFPDDGVAHALARLPGAVGPYLALTGRRLGRADAFALGLVTHCIDAAHFAEIERRLADAWPIDPLLDGLHRSPGDGEIARFRPYIDDCFAAATVDDIMERVRSSSGGGGAGAAWAASVLADLESASPLALKVALRHVRQARALDLRQTLVIDYRLGRRLLAAADFAEGVRAALIDKDGKPRWQAAHPADVSDATIDDLFQPEAGAELDLPTRQEMQAARI
jgi:enoyl-CoA hydratase